MEPGLEPLSTIHESTLRYITILVIIAIVLSQPPNYESTFSKPRALGFHMGYGVELGCTGLPFMRLMEGPAVGNSSAIPSTDIYSTLGQPWMIRFGDF